MKKKDMFFLGAFLISFMLCAVAMGEDFLCKKSENNDRPRETIDIEKQEEYIDSTQDDLTCVESETQQSDEQQKSEEVQQGDEQQKSEEVQQGDEQQKSDDGQQSDVSEAQDNPAESDSEDKPKPEGTLFIGDSRTVGLMEYGNIEGADFFAEEGMSVFKLEEKEIAVGELGKLTLEELLTNKRYANIYLMLGINELGYKFEAVENKYQEVFNLLQTMQSEAVIYLCANMHVTKAQSEKDKIYNNPNINQINQMISGLADGEQSYYIDVNELFDDENGNLADVYSSDSFHVLGRYYSDWAEWLEEKR